MRPESKKKIIVRGKEIGGQYPLVCLPLVADNKNDLLEQARDFVNLQPDIIEWRVDGFAAVENIGRTTEALRELRKTIGEIPLIFTCRCINEGGFKEISPSARKDIIIAALKTGLLDIIDFEISNGEEFINEVKEAVKLYGGKLILSYHNFKTTPDEEFIINKLKEASSLEADIAKIAVMPSNYRDVLNLLSATLKVRTEVLNIPVITMAMGEIGSITRIAGGLFGSDVTFAIGREASAPGQIPLADLRNVWKVLPF